jgi:hypothetical protein
MLIPTMLTAFDGIQQHYCAQTWASSVYSRMENILGILDM